MFKTSQKIIRLLSYWMILNLIVGLSFIPSSFAQGSRRGLFFPGQGQDSESGDSFGNSLGEEGGSEDVGLGQIPGLEMSGRGRRGYGTPLIYQIHVLGEVRNPGTHRVSPSMRVTDALKLANGIDKNGSERFVELRKTGHQTGRVIDLFAYKVLGKISQNPYLRDNDTIFVPLKKKAVEIEGPIRRPGVYELKNEKTLYDIITLAGGFTVGANSEEPIKVVRYRAAGEKEIFEIDDEIQDMKAFALQDGDVIVIEHKFLAKHRFDYNLKKLPNDNIFYPAHENKVFVIGAVKGAGAFNFNQYYQLRQYLTLAGGTTVMAKKNKIRVIRVDGKSFKAKNGNFDGVINPGDTIVVPEKAVPTAFYIGLLPTIASLGLSAAALFTR